MPTFIYSNEFIGVVFILLALVLAVVVGGVAGYILGDRERQQRNAIDRPDERFSKW